MAQTSLKEIEAFFITYKFTDSPMLISTAETSLNLKKTVETHIQTLKSNPNNERFLPYYKRLLLIYKLVKK